MSLFARENKEQRLYTELRRVLFETQKITEQDLLVHERLQFLDSLVEGILDCTFHLIPMSEKKKKDKAPDAEEFEQAVINVWNQLGEQWSQLTGKDLNDT